MMYPPIPASCTMGKPCNVTIVVGIYIILNYLSGALLEGSDPISNPVDGSVPLISNLKIITIFGNYLINCLLNEFGLLVNTIKYKLNHQNQDLKSLIKFGSLVLNKNHQSWKSSGLCHHTSGHMTTLHVGTNPRNKAVYWINLAPMQDLGLNLGLQPLE